MKSKNDAHFHYQLDVVVKAKRELNMDHKEFGPMYSWPNPHQQLSWWSTLLYKLHLGENPLADENGRCGCWAESDEK